MEAAAELAGCVLASPGGRQTKPSPGRLKSKPVVAVCSAKLSARLVNNITPEEVLRRGSWHRDCQSDVACDECDSTGIAISLRRNAGSVHGGS
jgi:hypothetical protein